MCEDDYWLGDVFDSVRRSALYAAGRAETKLRASISLAPEKEAMSYLCREYARYAGRVAEGRTDLSERPIFHQVGKLIVTWDRIVHEVPGLAAKMRCSSTAKKSSTEHISVESLL